MTAKRTPKIEALVVNAIRRLQDAQGSTPKEITNYIMQEYDASGPQIRKQIQLALRRGVSYGILQCTKGGYYTCNRDFLGKQPIEGDEVTECRSRRRRRRSSRRRGCARRRSARSRRRRRSCRSRRTRRRRSCGKRRRRSRARRRSRRGRRCRGGMEMDALNAQPKQEASVSRNESQSDGSTVSASSDDRRIDDGSQDQQNVNPVNARMD